MTSQDDADKKATDGSISISDAVRWQDSLKKEIDFDKPDSELTPEQVVKKAVYYAMDEQLEKSLGKDVKKDIDNKRSKMDALSKFLSNLNKLTELGKEIEKNFILHTAYLASHFDKGAENHYFVVTRRMTDDVIGNKSLSTTDRVEQAKKILAITKVYRDKIGKELVAKQEIISALLLSFEKSFSITDFDLYAQEVGSKLNSERIRSQFQEWSNLSKELLVFHQKGIDAVEEDIDLDEILPKYVIENNGDITKNISGVEMTIKGERVVRLIKEANRAEKDIGERRSKIAEELFGSPDKYMDYGNKQEEVKKSINMQNPLEVKPWFRFAKVIYIIGLCLSLLLSFAVMSADSNLGFWFLVVVIVIFVIIRKAFYYITLGKTDWKK